MARPVIADVAVDDGVITAVGVVDEQGREEIDATGLAVTPGFVDVHTHYDGQVTWDPLLTPSIWHGITTVVMGNCGVGFAPAAADRRDWLIGLMEGVEGIPGASLREAIKWDWESVGEYLDALDRIPRAIDVAAQIPHGAVRAFVMGERGAANEPATDDDIARMAELVAEGVAAGAVGVSVNRLELHRGVDGREVPGTFASIEEISALIHAAREGSPDAVFTTILPQGAGADRAVVGPRGRLDQQAVAGDGPRGHLPVRRRQRRHVARQAGAARARERSGRADRAAGGLAPSGPVVRAAHGPPVRAQSHVPGARAISRSPSRRAGCPTRPPRPRSWRKRRPICGRGSTS